MRTAICGSRVPKTTKIAARSTGRLIPVTLGDLAVSNTATAHSCVKVSLGIARQAAGEARWADSYGAFRAT
jgi:hypothetical protein